MLKVLVVLLLFTAGKIACADTHFPEIDSDYFSKRALEAFKTLTSKLSNDGLPEIRDLRLYSINFQNVYFPGSAEAKQGVTVTFINETAKSDFWDGGVQRAEYQAVILTLYPDREVKDARLDFGAVVLTEK